MKTSILWEEKNLIEPVMKSENNGISGPLDIITSTKRNVLEKEWRDTGGIREKNKEKQRIYRKRHYERYKGVYKIKRKKLYQTYKEYFKKKSLKHIFKKLSWASNSRYKNKNLMPFDLWRIAKKQKLKCALTGEKLTVKNISLDHILPKSKGGLNNTSNIRLVTSPVNFAKRNLSDIEFVELCRKVLEFSKT